MNTRATQVLPKDVLYACRMLAKGAREFAPLGGHGLITFVRRVPSPLPLSHRERVSRGGEVERAGLAHFSVEG